MPLPSPDELVTLDADYWRFKLREPYTRVGYVEWDLWHSHTMVGELTEIVGPEFVTTVLATLPALMSRQVPVSHAVTGVLVERAPAFAVSLREAARRGMLPRALSTVYACQGQPGAEVVVSLAHCLTDPRHVAAGQEPPRGVVAGGVFDMYNVAIGALLEGLFPLPPGGLDSRRSALQSRPKPADPEDTDTPPVVRSTPEELVETAKRKGMAFPEVLHFVQWVKTRGA